MKSLLSFSDALRADIIEENIKKFKEDPNLNKEDPDYDDLLDPYNGYKYQTYIQNDLENNQIIFWEGWSEECWNSLYQKEEYQNLSKKEAIEKIIQERFPKIASENNLKIKDYNYFYYEVNPYLNIDDGYIMKIKMIFLF